MAGASERALVTWHLNPVMYMLGIPLIDPSDAKLLSLAFPADQLLGTHDQPQMQLPSQAGRSAGIS